MNATEQCAVAMLPSIADPQCHGRTHGRTDVEALTVDQSVNDRNAHTRIQAAVGSVPDSRATGELRRPIVADLRDHTTKEDA